MSTDPRTERPRRGLSWEQMEAANLRDLRDGLSRPMGERLEEVFRLSDFANELRAGVERGARHR